MYVSPESSLIIIAIAMCSILILFTLASMLIYRCCKDIEIQQIPATVYQRTRASIMWARNSVFSHRDDEPDHHLHASREFTKLPQSPV